MSQGTNMRYAPWTAEMDAQLLANSAAGCTRWELADLFGRTKGAIDSRLAKLLLPEESAPGLFGAGRPRCSPSQGTLSTRVFGLTKGIAGLSSGPRPNHSRRLDGDSALALLEAECGQCGYTTDKCSCDYGI